MSARYDVCTPRPKKDGGTFWVKIGTAWQNEKGIQLVFDALPLPDSEGRCVANLFVPKDKQQQQPQRETEDFPY
jgi:hypothetical protein